jgi:hypothetical protein
MSQPANHLLPGINPFLDLTDLRSYRVLVLELAGDFAGQCARSVALVGNATLRSAKQVSKE